MISRFFGTMLVVSIGYAIPPIANICMAAADNALPGDWAEVGKYFANNGVSTGLIIVGLYFLRELCIWVARELIVPVRDAYIGWSNDFSTQLVECLKIMRDTNKQNMDIISSVNVTLKSVDTNISELAGLKKTCQGFQKKLEDHMRAGA